MPILWRYLLGQYLKVLFFCVIAFIAVLLTTRLDEIAHFATLGAEGRYVLLFTLYQVPYILPIALPISCLISAIILVQNLSTTHEITALRASGMALSNILAPILFAAAFLSLGNFYVVSEMATHSHLSTNILKTELRAVNPLLILNNKHLMRLKGVFYDITGASHLGEFASNAILAMPNKDNSRINVMLAQNLEASEKAFIGTGMTMISSINSDNQEHFDHVMIENIGNATTAIKDFSQILQKRVWTLNNDHLQMPLLLARLQEQKQELNNPASDQKVHQRNISRAYTEVIRRLSVALAVFTFTLMGAAFGISISRNRSNYAIFFVVGLAAFYLIAYFAGKGVDHKLIPSALLYTVPHVVIIGLSMWMLHRATKGIE